MVSSSARRSSWPVMRVRTSSSCFWLSALVSALAKRASAMVEGSRCGLTKAPARGIATCEWMSTVVLFGLTSRPGLPCLRAAVAPYLFHCSGMRSVPCSSGRPVSKHAEVLGDDGVVELDLGRGAAEHHAPGIDDDDVVGKIERELDVLLDQHDRLALGLDLRDGAADLGDELRREPLRGLVQEEHTRIAHQGAADGEHLLLAAGERPGERGVPLGEPRKQLEYAGKRPATAAVAARLRRHHQVLAYGERAEHAPALRHQAHALARDHVGREAGDRLAIEADRAPPRLEQPHDRRHAGGLAGAVAAEEPEQAAAPAREPDALHPPAFPAIR